MIYKAFLMVTIILISCNCKKTSQNQKTNFETAKFDPAISNYPVYQEMQKVKECFNIFETDSSFKTSSIQYCILWENRDMFSCSEKYYCNSYSKGSDTLKISIGNADGYSGKGFQILYKDEEFKIMPFTWTHNMPDYQLKPVVEIKDQSLVLNKKQYKTGDSLFGKVNFHFVVEEFGERTEHFGKGYFRTQVMAYKINL